MEGLAPTLQLCLEVRLAIECGEPIMSALKSILPSLDKELSSQLLKMILDYEQTGQVDVRCVQNYGTYRGALLLILAQGLNGEPILSRLAEIEPEIRMICSEEIEKYIAALPLRAMLPVLLIQFPAFLILLLGPILNVLTKGLTS